MSNEHAFYCLRHSFHCIFSFEAHSCDTIMEIYKICFELYLAKSNDGDLTTRILTYDTRYVEEIN